MSITKFASVKFNQEKIQVCAELEYFIHNHNHDAFVLSGHAGTGKTSVIQALIGYLLDIDINVVLLASTGRATRVVSDKARYAAETVHRHIYILDENHLDEVNKVKRLRFKLRTNSNSADTVYIIDESSMISDNNTGSVFIQFGTGRLLKDFLSYTGNRKVIFAGDPCQLPPVHFTFSPALDNSFLQHEHARKVVSVNLNESMRFPPASGIFKVTDNLRKKVADEFNGWLNVYATGHSDIEITNNHDVMVEKYASRIKSCGIDNAIFITFSNALASETNLKVRNLLFKKPGILETGESLMVVQNNYLHNVSNGEHLEVTEVSNETKKIEGIKLRRIEAQVQDILGKRKIKPWIIEDLLLSNKPTLDNEQEALLFIDFIKRCHRDSISVKHPDFINILISDPYLNALRVKYGYAVTCHKAQGGEWSHVYVVFEGSLFFQDKIFLHRWAYTALSRAAQKLYLLNNNCIF